MSSISEATAVPAVVPSRVATRIYIGCAAAVLALMYWHVVAAMVLDWWREEGYSYGFLIPPLAAYANLVPPAQHCS